ncbi:MAG: hypothetical protein R2809_10915, partial [Flavobacteriales bacterium]
TKDWRFFHSLTLAAMVREISNSNNAEKKQALMKKKIVSICYYIAITNLIFASTVLLSVIISHGNISPPAAHLLGLILITSFVLAIIGTLLLLIANKTLKTNKNTVSIIIICLITILFFGLSWFLLGRT